MKYYLVIDIGTSSLRIVNITETHRIVDIESLSRKAGSILDPEKEWSNIFFMLKRIIARSAGITFSGIAVSSLLGWICIDQSGACLTPCYTYLHKETASFQVLSRSVNLSDLSSASGRKESDEWPAFLLCRLKKENPEVYNRISALVSLKDYINFKLTNVIAMDQTTAGYTFLYDIYNHTWNSNTLQTLNLDVNKLPTIQPSWKWLGTVNPSLLKRWNISYNIAVIEGSVDGSVGVLGAGGFHCGQAVNIMGTTDVLFIVTDKPIIDQTHSLVINQHVIPGLWLVGGPMGLFGGTIDWLCHNFCTTDKTYKQLTEEASAVPIGCNGVSFFPCMSGERTPYWDSNFRGTITGLSSSHTLSEVYRSVMESEGYTLNKIFHIAAPLGINPDSLIAMGGGANNNLWLQIKSDILQKKVLQSSMVEATAAGSVALCLIADGIDPQYVFSSTKMNHFYPNQQVAEEYQSFCFKYWKRHDLLEDFYALP